MLRTLHRLAIALTAAATCTAASHAGTVVIHSDDTDDIDSHAFQFVQAFEALGHDVTRISGSFLATDVASADLLWLLEPDDLYSAAEFTAMNDVLDAGGNVVFSVEHVGFVSETPARNANIDAGLNGLGTGMSVTNNTFVPVVSSVGPSNIATHPFTQGVTDINLFFVNSITTSGTAFPLITRPDGQALVAAQPFSNGFVLAFADHNSFLFSADSQILLGNLVPTAVPEPITTTGLTLMSLALLRRRRKSPTAE